MCQLTFGLMSTKRLNFILSQSAAFANTFADHRDGFGLYVPETDFSYRFYLDPWHSLNFTNAWDDKFVGCKPFFLHVRKASDKRLTGKNEYCHPLITDRIVLMHNGTLFLKDGNIPFDVLDSKFFLGEFDKEYLKNNNFLDSLKITMEKFYGKFAFLLFDKVNKESYVVRGSTATLFKSHIINKDTGKLLGYFVNTEKPSIQDIKVLFSNLSREHIYVADEETIELNKETIYKLTGTSLVEVGKITENSPPVKVYNGYGVQNQTVSNRGINRELLPEEVKEKDIVLAIRKIMGEWHMSVKYIDQIAVEVFGYSLIYFTKEDAITFTELFKSIEGKLKIKKKFLVGYWNIIGRAYMDEFKVHETYKIQFPYMLETDKHRFDVAAKDATDLIRKQREEDEKRKRKNKEKNEAK